MDKAVVGVTRQLYLTLYVRGAVTQGVHLEYQSSRGTRQRLRL